MLTLRPRPRRGRNRPRATAPGWSAAPWALRPLGRTDSTDITAAHDPTADAAPADQQDPLRKREAVPLLQSRRAGPCAGSFGVGLRVRLRQVGRRPVLPPDGRAPPAASIATGCGPPMRIPAPRPIPGGRQAKAAPAFDQVSAALRAAASLPPSRTDPWSVSQRESGEPEWPSAAIEAWLWQVLRLSGPCASAPSVRHDALPDPPHNSPGPPYRSSCRW
jgi:hypothetical protein